MDVPASWLLTSAAAIVSFKRAERVMVNPIYRFFQKLWRNLVSYIDKAPISAEEKNRLQQYTVFISLGIPTMAVYGLIHLNSHRYLLSGAILASCAGLCAGWYLFRELQNGRIIHRINAILFGFLIVTMVVIGGEGGSKILWMYVFPLVAFFCWVKSKGCYEQSAWADWR